MNLTESQISSELLYDGSFIAISRDKVRLPNGNESQRVVVRHPGAACVLAVTDQNEVVFVRQWRYALGQALLELPAGTLEVGEDPAECALRELEEETPYRADSVELMRTFFTAPGFCGVLAISGMSLAVMEPIMVMESTSTSLGRLRFQSTWPCRRTLSLGVTVSCSKILLSISTTTWPL